MFYHKFFPSAPLRPFVECYYIWEHHSAITTPLLVESPPNGFAAMVFNYGDRYDTIHSNGHTRIIPPCFLAGQFTRNYQLRLTGRIGMTGIVFKPAAVSTLFGVSMNECIDQRIDLSLILGNTARTVLQQIMDAASVPARIQVLESFLLNHLTRADFRIDIADHAADIILERKGIISVKELSAELGICRRQLERKFQQKVGLSPKYYARVKRLGYVCSLLIARGEAIDWQDAIFAGGFYDQSHFIKDFQEFIQQNPSLYYQQPRELLNFLEQ